MGIFIGKPGILLGVCVCVWILDKKCLFANEVLPSAVNIFVVNSFVAAENLIW